MSTAHSVTNWIGQLKAGEEVAAQKVWQRYYVQLVNLARRRLLANQRRFEDEEDVVVQAFHEFFRNMKLGKYPQIDDRDGLWRELATKTDQRTRDLKRKHRRQKRGGGMVRGNSVFCARGTDDTPHGFDQIADPTPEVVEQYSITCRELLNLLNEEQRRIALWKLSGFTNKEIAKELACVEETVRRKIKVIRNIWSEEQNDATK